MKEIKHQVTKNYNMKKTEINYYRNKVIDIKISKNYLDPVLIYKLDLKQRKKNSHWMTQNTIKTFLNEICLKAPQLNYINKKINVYHIDDIWSLDILDFEDYGPENIRGFRYVLVLIDIFSKYGWTIPLPIPKIKMLKYKMILLKIFK